MEVAADRIEEFGINVGRQLNVIQDGVSGPKAVSSGLITTTIIMSDEEYFRRYGRPGDEGPENFLQGAE